MLMAILPWEAEGKRQEGEKSIQQKTKTFLMLDGRLRKAVNSCVSLFKGAAVTGIRRDGPGGRGRDGGAGELPAV